jgi:hypothetical protein
MGLRAAGEVKIQYRAFGSRQLFVAAPRNQLSPLNFHLQGAPEKFGDVSFNSAHGSQEKLGTLELKSICDWGYSKSLI